MINSKWENCMKLFFTLYLVLTYSSNCASFTWKNTNEATKKLLQKIYDPKQYDKNIMPLEDSSQGPLIVKINMLIRNIHIDEKNMEYMVDMTFRMTWKDFRLQYEQFPDVNYVQFNDFTHIWTPDPFFKSSTETKILNTFGPEALVRIKSTGDVLLSTRMTVKSSCIMDLKMFPHDTQECQIKVASYGYADHRIVFESMMNDPLVMVKNSSHANRFDVSSFGVYRCDRRTTTGTYTCLSLAVRLHRTFSSYLLEWYLPCSCFVVISFMSHLMPSNEVLARIVLTITPMLALGVSSISYISKLPSVPYTTAFDEFTAASLLVIFFSLVHVVASYYLHRGRSLAKSEDASHSGTPNRMKSFPRMLVDIGFRMVIVGFYVFFLVIYSIKYHF